jgi:hypothetical protein
MLTALLAGLVIGGVGYAAYLFIAYQAIPGFAEERFGVLELPEGIGEWKLDEESPEGRAAREQGLRRQVRLWRYPDRGLLGAGKVVRQVRYENAVTGEVERIEPEVTIKLRRSRRAS